MQAIARFAFRETLKRETWTPQLLAGRSRARARSSTISDVAIVPMSLFRAVVLAVVSGFVYAAAFPPFGLFPLAWIALVPLLVALAHVRVPLAAALGAVFALTASLALCWWLPGTLRDFFGIPLAWGGLASVAVFLAFAAPYCAIFAGLIAWLAARGPVHPLVVASAFGACEWARANWLVANPWGMLGTSQLAWPPAAQSLDVLGVVGLGMGIVAVNACVAAALARVYRPTSGPRAVVLVGGLLAVLLGYGTLRLEQSFGDGPEARVVLVPGAAPRTERFVEAHRDRTLDRHLSLTSRAALLDPDLVVWPEFAVDFVLRDDGRRRSRLSRAARDLGAELLFGAPDYQPRRIGVDRFNSIFLMRGGRLVDRYDKVRLTPLSEASVFGAIGTDRYTPGSRVRPVKSAAGPLGVLVCVEALYADHVRDVVAAGAGLLVNPSNDDWFSSRSGRMQQLLNVAARAVESRRWLLRASQGGATAAIDPHGRIRTLDAGAGEASSVLLATVRSSTATTPYLFLGDVAPLAGALLLVGAIVRRRTR